jgi:hypothetical protein
MSIHIANKRDWKLLVKRKKKASMVVGETEPPETVMNIIFKA